MVLNIETSDEMFYLKPQQWGTLLNICIYVDAVSDKTATYK